MYSTGRRGGLGGVLRSWSWRSLRERLIAHWDATEYGGALAVYAFIAIVVALIHTVLLPSLEFDSDPADGGWSTRSWLHLAYAVLPTLVVGNIWLTRSISPGYLQDLREIEAREQRKRRHREQTKAAQSQREAALLLAPSSPSSAASPSQARNGNADAFRGRDESTPVEREESKERDELDGDVEHALLHAIHPPPPPPPAAPPAIAAPPSNEAHRGLTFHHADDDESSSLDFAALDLAANPDTSSRRSTRPPQVALAAEVQLTTLHREVTRDTPQVSSPVITHAVHVASATWCLQCDSARPPRAGHCSMCHTCVLAYDHHCGVIGACIGQYNYRFFFWFVFWASVALIGLVSLLILWLIQIPFYEQEAWSEWPVYIAIFGLGGCVFASGMPVVCMLMHCSMILHNVTLREHTGKQSARGTASFFNCCVRPWSEIWCEPMVWRDQYTPNDSNTLEFKLRLPPRVRDLNPQSAASTYRVDLALPLGDLRGDLASPFDLPAADGTRSHSASSTDSTV